MYLNVAAAHCAVMQWIRDASRSTRKLEGTERNRLTTDKADAQGQEQRKSEKPANF